MKYKAIIFDLDGVVVSTDECHYLAWKKLADEEGIYFDRTINMRLRGVSRMESLEIVLERAEKAYAQEQKIEMAARKNGYYVEMIQTIDSSAILEGAVDFCNRMRDGGAKLAIGSSSKNTKLILKQIGLSDFFDAVADGNDIKNSKPDPEVFLCAAGKLGIAPKDCMVVEDADAGVEAALAAGMDVLAVGSAMGNKKATYRAENLAKAEISL